MMYYSSQYVSDELFHFVGRNERTQDAQFSVLVKILKTGLLQSSECPDPFSELKTGSRLLAGELTRVPAICFCDIPRQSLGLHVKKYSAFGLSFSKSFLSSKGARPVFYIPLRSTVSQGHGNRGQEFPKNMRTLLNALWRLQDIKKDKNWNKRIDDSQIRQLVSTATNQSAFLTREVFQFIKVYDDELEEAHEKNYYMEREWRIVENLEQTRLNFSLDDVKAVMVPFMFQLRLPAEIPDLSGKIVATPGWM